MVEWADLKSSTTRSCAMEFSYPDGTVPVGTASFHLKSVKHASRGCVASTSTQHDGHRKLYTLSIPTRMYRSGFSVCLTTRRKTVKMESFLRRRTQTSLGRGCSEASSSRALPLIVLFLRCKAGFALQPYLPSPVERSLATQERGIDCKTCAFKRAELFLIRGFNLAVQ